MATLYSTPSPLKDGKKTKEEVFRGESKAGLRGEGGNMGENTHTRQCLKEGVGY